MVVLTDTCFHLLIGKFERGTSLAMIPILNYCLKQSLAFSQEHSSLQTSTVF